MVAENKKCFASLGLPELLQRHLEKAMVVEGSKICNAGLMKALQTSGKLTLFRHQSVMQHDFLVEKSSLCNTALF